MVMIVALLGHCVAFTLYQKKYGLMWCTCKLAIFSGKYIFYALLFYKHQL